MKILALEKSAATPFDFKAFSRELQELSERHGVKLVSVGALSGLETGKGITYLGIWSDAPAEK